MSKTKSSRWKAWLVRVQGSLDVDGDGDDGDGDCDTKNIRLFMMITRES